MVPRWFRRCKSTKPHGQLQEVMLRETAASWTREKLSKTLPKLCWEETAKAHRARLKASAAHINGICDVGRGEGGRGLCRELPSRARELDRRQGDRLAK